MTNGICAPVLTEQDGIFMATFSSKNPDNFGFPIFARAFAQGAANNKAKNTLAVLRYLAERRVMTPEEFSKQLTRLQKNQHNRYSKFTNIKLESGDWLFMWVCFPYRFTDHDNGSDYVSATPRRTILKLIWGPNRKELQISGERKTSVDRRAKAAMGHKVPVAWTTVKGLNPHPVL